MQSINACNGGHWHCKRGQQAIFANPLNSHLEWSRIEGLLFGRLVDGGRLNVDLDDKDESKTEVLLDISPLPKREGKAKPEAQEAAVG